MVVFRSLFLIAAVNAYSSSDEYEPMDLGIRFNKFSDTTGGDPEFAERMPLGEADYPIGRNEDTFMFVTTKTSAAEVVNHLTDIEVKYPIEELIDIAGGLPSNPNSDPDHPFWGLLAEVIEAVSIDRDAPASTALANKMQLPLRMTGYTVGEVGESVHGEYPGRIQADFVWDLADKKLYGPIEFDNQVLSQRSGGRFLHGIVALADLLQYTIGIIGPHSFGVKWFAGRARPEEVAFKVATGDITTSCIPEGMKENIDALMMEQAADFGQYGAPVHPSWPAMHSAASNVSMWLRVVLNLTDQQFCEAKKLDYYVAYARTVAGVHYSDDNIAGLNMGQEVAARELIGYLPAKYNSDKMHVKEKIEAMRFDWRDYDPLEDCSAMSSSV